MENISDLAILVQPLALQPLTAAIAPNIGRARFMERINDVFDRRWLTNKGIMLGSSKRRWRLWCRHRVATWLMPRVAWKLPTRALELRGGLIVPSFTFATAHASSEGDYPVFSRISHLYARPGRVEELIPPRTGILCASGARLWSDARTIARRRGS